MPPTSSLWTAVIAAAAALLGVFLGQLLQSRREDRNFKRQAEEQRRRDAEQREDQRLRDEAQWRREEARRFVEQRREMYAEFLTAGTNIEEAIDEVVLHSRQADNEARNNRRTNLRPVSIQIKEVMWGKLEGLRLVAPEPVVELSGDYILKLINEVTRFSTENLVPLELRQERRDLRLALQMAMRDDVTGSP